MRLIQVYFLVSALMGCLHAAEDGFVTLLDAGHMDGWVQCGEPVSDIRDGLITTTRRQGVKGQSTVWYSKSSFSDFILRLEYRGMAGEYNSGVHLRFASPGTNSDIVRDTGYEVAIVHTSSDRFPSGSITFYRNAIKGAQKSEWNALEITAIGQSYLVRLNGKVVNQYLGDRLTTGYIGLQNHPAGAVQFRNIRLRTLPRGDHVSLLDASLLSYALTSRAWTWTAPGVYTNLVFNADGSMSGNQGQPCHWKALDAYTLLVSPKTGNSITLTFSEDYTSYVQANVYESPIAGAATVPDPFCGTWKWFDGAMRVIFPDGTVGDTKGKRYGKWHCKNPEAARKASRHYKITYDGGKFEDHMELLNGGTFAMGLNNYRLIIRAYRQSE